MGERLILETDRIRASMDTDTLKVDVLDKTAGVTWETPADGPHDIGVRIGGVSSEHSFASNFERTILRPAVFSALNCFVGFELAAGRGDEIVITLGEAPGTGRPAPMAGSFPRNFITPVSSNAYTIFPAAMGMLIPGNWHSFVDGDFEHERAEFASGVSVECNQRDKTFRIHGLSGLEEKMMPVPGWK